MLTLPDPSDVDVHLHRVRGVERLVIVEDKDVPAQGMDPGGVHRCILGHVRTDEDGAETAMLRSQYMSSQRKPADPEPTLSGVHRSYRPTPVLSHPPPASVPALSPTGCARRCRLHVEDCLRLPTAPRLSGRWTKEALQQERPQWAPALRSSGPPSAPACLTGSGSVTGHKRSWERRGRRFRDAFTDTSAQLFQSLYLSGENCP